MRFGFSSHLAGSILLGISCSAPATEASEPALSVYASPSRMVEVEPGRRLNLICMGTGSPTIIFESGLGVSADSWYAVQPEIAKQTRACSYERAGIGFSNAATRPGTAIHVVDDLHTLLAKARIAAPIVLVGHSSGGMYVRMYAYLHPADVAGMVLVDPSNEEQAEGYRLLSPEALSRTDWERYTTSAVADSRACAKQAGEPGGLAVDDELYKKCVSEPPEDYPPVLKAIYTGKQESAKYQLASGSEYETLFYQSADQLRAARRNLRDLPLVVLTHAPRAKSATEKQALRDARNRLWSWMHQSVADSSSRGEHRTVSQSDHMIQWKEPDAVIQAIHDVLAEIKATH